LAPTGSGKTLAAFLWSIDQLFRKSLEMDARKFDQNPSGVHTLYISPLKALNNDIHQNLKEPLKEIGVSSTPAAYRKKLYDRPPIIWCLWTAGSS